MTPVRFYDAKERPYGFFSNYALSPLRIEGKDYASVEHYYQSQKYAGVNEELVETIRTAKTPHQAKVIASMRQGGGYGWRTALNPVIARFQEQGALLRKDWEEVKEDVMRSGLRAKFAQNPQLAKLLRDTGTNPLIENSASDDCWGCGADGNGKNRLGALLAEVRTELATVSV